MRQGSRVCQRWGKPLLVIRWAAMAKKRGKFITLEGVEGSGKSTQIKRLSAWLEASGRQVLLTKQPGGTGIGGRIREILLDSDHGHMDPWCEVLLYLADRAQHVSERIRPALEQGIWVLCDRYQDSTCVYQCTARALDAELVERIFDQATGHLLPDLTLVLDLDPAVGLARARDRNASDGLTQSEGRFEQESLDFHHAVRDGFRRLADRAQQRVKLVDASGSTDVVQARLRQLIDSGVSHHV